MFHINFFFKLRMYTSYLEEIFVNVVISCGFSAKTNRQTNKNRKKKTLNQSNLF